MALVGILSAQLVHSQFIQSNIHAGSDDDRPTAVTVDHVADNTFDMRIRPSSFYLAGHMTQQEIHDGVLAFLRKNIVFDEKKVIPDDESFLGSGILDSTGILELIGYLEGEYRRQVS